MVMRGIDVSKWQRDIDFAKVKAYGASFVIIRAGYGRQKKDPYFDRNYERAKAAGLHVGVYWYSYAGSVKDALQEAEMCLSVIRGKQLDYPVYFDLEEKKQFAKGSAFCDSIVKAFCNRLEQAGYFTGLYISASPLKTHISKEVAERYTIWVAQYAKRCTYGGKYGIWQYSSKANVPGVAGNCDMDESYVDFPGIIRKRGLNGYTE